jgi:hypothetical protein
VVVIIPSHLQVYPEIWQEIVAEEGLDPNLYDLSAPNRQLVALCRALEIPALDLLPELRGSAPSELPLYYKTNPHWTPAGHRVAAQAIRAFLDQSYFQPSQPRPGCP